MNRIISRVEICTPNQPPFYVLRLGSLERIVLQDHFFRSRALTADHVVKLHAWLNGPPPESTGVVVIVPFVLQSGRGVRKGMEKGRIE